MNYAQYIKDAVRTEAPYDKMLLDLDTQPNRVHTIRRMVQCIIETAQMIDLWKKHLFYGKGTQPGLPFNPVGDVDTSAKFLSQPVVHRMMHACMGMVTEAGELLEQVFNEDPWDVENLIEESGDVKWYGGIADDAICQLVTGLDPDYIFTANIAKLRVRFPGKFTEQHANERDTKAEMKALDASMHEGNGGCIPGTFINNCTFENNRRAGDQVEKVNHPEHYGGDTTYETIKVIHAWELDFNLGSVVKYISRHGKKPGEGALDDLRKALWYLQDEIKELELHG